MEKNLGGRWPAGMAAELMRAFVPGSYRVVATDRERGLRGEATFAIAPGDPPRARVEVVLE